jgi:2'-5' RNA ligase
VVRRQVTAFLPAPIGERVDEIRARWDPEMAHRIAAHITMVHDWLDDDVLQSGLDLIAASPQLMVHLTEARCWGAPEHGIYLGVEDTRGDIDRIRKSFRVVDPVIRYEPHVTLIHSRTVPASRSQEAWGRLANWAINATAVIDSLCVIELRGSQWQVVTEVSLTSD